MDEKQSKSILPHVSYLPPPHLTAKSPSPTFKPPQSKKQKINLPSPNIPTSPTSMDQNAMDIHIREHRLNSLDALIQDNIADDDIQQAWEESKHIALDDNDNQKLIALINSSSGARKGFILSRELKQYDASVYYLRDLSIRTNIQKQLGLELEKYNNKCIVLICGGDGSQAWACSLIDKALSFNPSCISFPQIAVFPMGTGNDLSRCLGWGSLEPNHKNIIQYIADINFCRKITKRWSDIDRWRVTYTFDHIIESNRFNIDFPDTKKYKINPTKQFYMQQDINSKTYKHLKRYNPPLPSTFLCYLSIGYDALVAYKFEKERRSHPERFNNQIKNQVMYVKHGFTEFFKPSNPINDCVDVIINGENINKSLPSGCRSLKVININSAMNGLFFWGKGESRDFEYKQQCRPQLNDGMIEVMATRGVHDMCMYRVNVSHAQRISQCNDIIIRFKKIPKNENGIALQIDGEAWIIKHKCTLRIQIHDKIPTIVGYKEPRGVESWLMASLNDQHIIQAKESYRDRLKKEYQILIPPKSPSDEDKNESDEDKNDKNIISTSFMSLFNINNSNKNNINESETPEEVDIPQYIENNPSIKKQKNHIFQSSIFSPSKSPLNNGNGNEKDNKSSKDIFLDRFTWWKVTKAKNHNQSIDAEIATDALSPNTYATDRNSKKSQSFTVLPKKRLF